MGKIEAPNICNSSLWWNIECSSLVFASAKDKAGTCRYMQECPNISNGGQNWGPKYMQQFTVVKYWMQWVVSLVFGSAGDKGAGTCREWLSWNVEPLVWHKPHFSTFYFRLFFLSFWTFQEPHFSTFHSRLFNFFILDFSTFHEPHFSTFHFHFFTSYTFQLFMLDFLTFHKPPFSAIHSQLFNYLQIITCGICWTWER